MFISLRPLLLPLLIVVLLLSGCGGAEQQDGRAPDAVQAETEPADDETKASPTEGCSDIEEVEVGSPQHVNRELTAEDYSSNPPAGGDHSSDTAEVGTIYDEPQPLGPLVHSLEHGAVIGWTNGLSEEQTQQVEDAFNALFQDGYKSLIVVEYPDMDVPFALSAWGAVQTCSGIDPVAIGTFVGTYYGSGPEGELACVDPQGGRVKVPTCKS